MRKIGVTLAVLLLSAAIVQAQTVGTSTALTLQISASGEATLVNNTAAPVAFKSYIIKTTSAALRPMTTASWDPTGSGSYKWAGPLGSPTNAYDPNSWTPIQERVAYYKSWMDKPLWALPGDGGAGILSNLDGTAPTDDPDNDLDSYGNMATGRWNGFLLWGIPNQDCNTTTTLAETAMSTTQDPVFWVREAASGAALISLGKIVNPFDPNDAAAATALQNLFSTPTGGAHTFQWANLGGEYTGQVVVEGAAVPEPATMSLLVLGGLSALLRRRR